MKKGDFVSLWAPQQQAQLASSYGEGPHLRVLSVAARWLKPGQDFIQQMLRQVSNAHGARSLGHDRLFGYRQRRHARQRADLGLAETKSATRNRRGRCVPVQVLRSPACLPGTEEPRLLCTIS